MKRMLATLVALVALAVASTAYAGEILVDRGLPTTNLNNAAGSLRSNVSWVFTQYTETDYWLVGDTFQNTGPQTWYVDTISLWITGDASTAVLWGGTGASIGVVSSAGVIVPGVTYQDDSTYQVPSNTYRSIQRIDFAVDFALAPGQTYSFFLDGTGNGTLIVPFVHASNAPLSGSTQQGADGLMLYRHIVDGIFVPADAGAWSSSEPGGGWDKASDVNVQVYGTVPDGGTTLTLLGCALMGLGVVRRRFRG